MSKSYKKPIYKDKGWAKDIYHKKLRVNVNQALREAAKSGDVEDLILPEAREVVNDYEYSDYTWDARFDDNDELKIKLSRK